MLIPKALSGDGFMLGIAIFPNYLQHIAYKACRVAFKQMKNKKKLD